MCVCSLQITIVAFIQFIKFSQNILKSLHTTCFKYNKQVCAYVCVCVFVCVWAGVIYAYVLYIMTVIISLPSIVLINLLDGRFL